MKTRKTKIYEIAITMIPLVGPVIARQLISFCGSIEAVFTEQKRMLKTIPGIGEEIASKVTNAQKVIIEAEEELDLIEKEKINYTFLHYHNYPSWLLHIPDAPLLLYIKGNVELNPERCISI